MADFRIDAPKLLKAAKRAYNDHAGFRASYQFARGELAGPWFGLGEVPQTRWDVQSDEPGTECPVSLIDELIDTYLPNLTGPQMKAILQPVRPSLRGWATLRQAKLNLTLKLIDFANVDRLVVQDMLMSGMGCYRTGIRAGSDLLQVSRRLSAQIQEGDPFVKRISPIDIIRDPEARDPSEERFYGHIYTVEREYAQELGICDPDVLEQLEPLSHSNIRKGNGPAGNDDLDIIDQVELIDLIVFKGGKAYEMTLAPWDNGPEKFVIEPREYDGCELGMLEFVGLHTVNECVRGKAPAQKIMDLHLATKEMARKMVRQSLKHKRVNIYRQDQSDTVEDIRVAGEEDFVAGDPDAHAPVEQGGILQGMQEAYGWMRQESNKSSANVQLLGGRGMGGRGTATGDSILQGNATAILQWSREQVNASRVRVLQRLSDYEDTYEGQPQTIAETIETGDEVEFLYDPATREGRWHEYNHSILVTTTSSQDTNSKQRRLVEMMQSGPQFLMAVAQMGGDVEAAADLIAREFEIEEFSEVFKTSTSQQIDQAMAQQVAPPGQPVAARTLRGGKATPMGRPGMGPTGALNLTRSDLAATVPQ